MKKRILIVVCILVVIILGGVCFSNRPVPLKIDQDVEMIMVRYGNTGEYSDITDATEINRIVSEINELNLQRDHRLKPSTGWVIVLDIHFEDKTEYDRYTIRDDGIEYNNYFYGENEATEKLQEQLVNMFE